MSETSNQLTPEMLELLRCAYVNVGNMKVLPFAAGSGIVRHQIGEVLLACGESETTLASLRSCDP